MSNILSGKHYEIWGLTLEGGEERTVNLWPRVQKLEADNAAKDERIRELTAKLEHANGREGTLIAQATLREGRIRLLEQGIENIAPMAEEQFYGEDHLGWPQPEVWEEVVTCNDPKAVQKAIRNLAKLLSAPVPKEEE